MKRRLRLVTATAVIALASTLSIGASPSTASSLVDTTPEIGDGGRSEDVPADPDPTEDPGESAEPTEEPESAEPTQDAEPEPTEESPAPDNADESAETTPDEEDESADPTPDPVDEPAPEETETSAPVTGDPVPVDDDEYVDWEDIEPSDGATTPSPGDENESDPTLTDPSEPVDDGNDGDEDEPTEPADPTDPVEPTDPGESPDPGESTDPVEPTDPVEDPTEDQTPDEPIIIPDEPIEDDYPFEDPTEDPFDPPTSDDDPTWVEENSAPVFEAFPPLTAPSRANISNADLYRGVVARDDRDLGVVPKITGWGNWLEANECPGGYPCTYTLVYTAVDSDGAVGRANRTITITGPAKQDNTAGMDWVDAVGRIRPTEPTESVVDETRPDQPQPGAGDTATGQSGTDELAQTGANATLLVLGGFGLLAVGAIAVLTTRKKK